MMMVQCLLMREGAKQTAWIPAEAAWPGNLVELKDDHEFWAVAQAYREAQVPEEEVKENERNFKTHRKATDI